MCGRSFPCFILAVLTFLTLNACSHLPRIGGFRGPGDFRAPAEYGYRPAPRDHSLTGFRLRWPVQTVQLNRGFRPRRAPRHQGVDLGGRRGAPILAAHDGKIIYSGRDFNGYGNMVLVEYSRHWATLYGHLDRIDAKAGTYVRAGETIGRMGRTGHATGVHLHFELIRDRQPVDPLPYLKHVEFSGRLAERGKE